MVREHDDASNDTANGVASWADSYAFGAAAVLDMIEMEPGVDGFSMKTLQWRSPASWGAIPARPSRTGVVSDINALRFGGY